MMSDQGNTFFSRIGRLLRHVKYGTLGERIHFEINKRELSSRPRRWEKAKQKSGYVETTVSGGAKMRLYTDSKLAELIYLHNFEMKERLFVRRYLREGDIFVDIGANNGLFTIEAVVTVGKSGKVFAFEPNPKIYARLQENIRLNKLNNVTALQLAVSDEPGRGSLLVSKDGFDAWSSFGKPIAGEAFENVEVAVTTLAAFLESTRLDKEITMIKIDVEGWETSVLRGGSDYLSLRDAPLLQVEFTRLAALNANSSCEDLFQMLQKLGYTVCTYDQSANLLKIIERCLDWEYENLFATKNLEQANQRLAKGSVNT